ncbi:hypothetical protein B0H66DRAFT_380906 [Apodospora peruviana]|uniref:Rhodopsin domain-containing protein n=1 Tax=Apodospora peruviana TaxID=516989 RepID=A0AAE0HTV9_9PEZI|nr:hypothetical protein B0H66DRAFT_380906 [Apodospora peruviana]
MAVIAPTPNPDPGTTTGGNAGAFIAAGPPPPGVIPNLDNPENIGYQLVIIASVFPAITGVFLLLRLYTAAFILKRWHVDDYLVIVAFVFALGDSATNIIQTHHGAGKHMWEVSKETYREFNMIGAMAGAICYHLSTLFAKYSILSFYLRFSVDTGFRYAVYFVMFVATGYTVPSAFAFLFQCTPMNSLWDSDVVGRKCVDAVAMCNATGVLNTVTDLAILLLPIWLLRPLRIPLLKKMGVAIILMTGGFVVGISAKRTYTVLDNASTDFTYRFVPNLVWFLIEMYVGILCACLPTMKPFMKRFFPSFFAFSSNLESRLSASLHIASIRLDTLTGGRLNRRRHSNMIMTEDRSGALSRAAVEALESKASSVYARHDDTLTEGGSSSEGSSSSSSSSSQGIKKSSSASTLREDVVTNEKENLGREEV